MFESSKGPKLPPNYKEFDVNAWMQLAKSDPHAFERKRQEWIQETIQSAPAHMHQRLKGMQFEIDAIRTTSGNALSAAIKVSKLMWKRLGDLKSALEGDIKEHKISDNKAKVLQFKEPENAF